MINRNKNQKSERIHSVSTPVCGRFDKNEAARMISEGVYHIHSSPFGSRDPLAKITTKILNDGQMRQYPWELISGYVERHLLVSCDRSKVIRELLDHSDVVKQSLREKTETVFEELASNAFYHAYADATNPGKYARNSTVKLSPVEALTFQFSTTPDGVYLSLKDRGGAIQFSTVQDNFRRCLTKGEQQIDTKESGAGLGLYMVFDCVTHLKVVVAPGLSTEVACWISSHSAHAASNFSFNFFNRKE